ncbi:MAG: nitroreductase [Actinobacteria bacterium HGW-Actinobacteria-10]|jgi:nitroreductase|nr:MAG: nitroreductase [Actinobacteria bacterium HGW-Actinobacteria-10]
MEFSEVVTRRRSVRKFDGRPLEDEALEYVLQAARVAPSASNRQRARFVVVRDPAKLSVIGRRRTLADGRVINRWLTDAPAIIVACGERSGAATRYGVDWWQVDTSIATEHLVLAAVDIGLGTCWIGVFDEPVVRAELGIPAQFGILALIAIGYPAGQMSASERMTRTLVRADHRKPMTELVHWDTW